MPIVYEPQEDQQEAQGQVQGEQQPQSGGMISGSGTSGLTQGTQEPSKSGSYTNLRSYLDANVGAGKQMAEGIAGQAQKTIGKTETQAADVQSQFQQNIQSGGVGYGEAEKGIVSQVGIDPTQVDVGAFSKLREATYTGPGSYGAQQQDAYSQLQSNIGKLGTVAASTQTGGGQRALLKQTYGQPAYSAGEVGLDQFLMQAPGASREIFSNLRADIGTLSPALAQQQTQGTQDILARQTETQAAQAAAQGALGLDPAGNILREGLVGQEYAASQTLANQRLQEAQDQYAEYSNALTSNDFSNLSDEQLANLGITDRRQTLYNALNAPLESYITQNPLEGYTQSAALSGDESAKINALLALSGQAGEGFGYDPTQAGTLGQGYEINKEKIAADIAAANMAFAPIPEAGRLKRMVIS